MTRRFDHLDNEALCSLWQDAGDAEARKELVLRFGGLAGSRARKFRNVTEAEDLRQTGLEAILGATNTWDGTKGDFASHAYQRVLELTGEVVARRNGFGCVNRSLLFTFRKHLREHDDDVEKAIQATVKARRCTEERVRSLAAATGAMASIDAEEWIAPGRDPTEDVIDGIERKRRVALVRSAMEVLVGRDREFFVQRQLRERSLVDIARENGISPEAVRKSVLRSERRLRARVEELAANPGRMERGVPRSSMEASHA